MLCLWHTTNSANGLNLKALAHAFSQFDENLGTRAVPAGADGLFHKKKHRDSIILGQIVRQVLFIFTHPLADHAIIVGVAHRLQFLLYGSNGLWLSVRELYKHERTDIFTDFFISASDSFPFCICKVEQIIVIIGNFCVVSHAFIDVKSLGNKACTDNIYFIDFKELVSLIFNSSSTDTNNVLGRKSIDDSLCLGSVVGVLLINNDDKFHTGTMCISNTIKEILTLTITNGCVTTFCYKFPVDECCAAGCKSIQQCIEQILCCSARSERHHFLTALFLKITLAGAEPDKSSISTHVGKVGIHIIDEDDGFTGTGRRFHNNCLFTVFLGSKVNQLDNGLFLKIK